MTIQDIAKQAYEQVAALDPSQSAEETVTRLVTEILGLDTELDFHRGWVAQDALERAEVLYFDRMMAEDEARFGADVHKAV